MKKKIAGVLTTVLAASLLVGGNHPVTVQVDNMISGTQDDEGTQSDEAEAEAEEEQSEEAKVAADPEDQPAATETPKEEKKAEKETQKREAAENSSDSTSSDEKTLLKKAKKLAQQYDVEPYYVPLEVTESMFTEYVDKLYKNITRLQSAGFRFSMDDFGAGYSSLNMLKDEPVDEVKIDRFFLKDIKKEKSQIVIRNVIHMIQELQLDMIVEGIETKEQAELLMNYGSYKAQGYYYYKPMPMTEFEQLLIKQQKGL